MGRVAPFKQADVARALRGAEAAGLKPSGCTILPDGTIRIDFGEAAGGAPRRSSRLDRLLEP